MGAGVSPCQNWPVPPMPNTNVIQVSPLHHCAGPNKLTGRPLGSCFFFKSPVACLLACVAQRCGVVAKAWETLVATEHYSENNEKLEGNGPMVERATRAIGDGFRN